MSELTMHQTGIALTLACNLNCRLCSNYAPYYQHPAYSEFAELQEMMRRYFSVVTHVHKLMITGGEPFLHPDLGRFIREMGQYRSQIDIFGCITNGTLPPREDVIAAIQEYMQEYRGDFQFIIDNYGPNLSKNVVQLSERFEKEGIPCIIKNYTDNNPHCGGFVDFGDLARPNPASRDEAEALYSICAYPQKLKLCFDMVRGSMYPCGPCRRCAELGIVDDYSEYINLFDDTLTVEEQREKIRLIYNRKSLGACAYCNGMHDDSLRFRPAQQLTKEELELVRNGARFYSEIKR